MGRQRIQLEATPGLDREKDVDLNQEQNVRDDSDDEDDDDDQEEEGVEESSDDSDDGDNDRHNFTVTRSSPGILTPAPHDIICGRGKMTSLHPGNRRLRDLVLEKKHAYQRARRRDDKTRITFEVVQTFKDNGSKFLLYDPKTELWYDVGDEYAREKVSHSLRSRPNEHRRTKPKPGRKSSLRKIPQTPAIDKIVCQLIHDQQSLLKSMIENETTVVSNSDSRKNDSAANGTLYKSPKDE